MPLRPISSIQEPRRNAEVRSGARRAPTESRCRPVLVNRRATQTAVWLGVCLIAATVATRRHQRDHHGRRSEEAGGEGGMYLIRLGGPRVPAVEDAQVATG